MKHNKGGTTPRCTEKGKNKKEEEQLQGTGRWRIDTEVFPVLRVPFFAVHSLRKRDTVKRQKKISESKRGGRGRKKSVTKRLPAPFPHLRALQTRLRARLRFTVVVVVAPLLPRLLRAARRGGLHGDWTRLLRLLLLLGPPRRRLLSRLPALLNCGVARR